MAQRARQCRLTVEWLDADGFIVDDDTERIQLRCCGAFDNFRGYDLITQPATQQVVSASAKVACD